MSDFSLRQEAFKKAIYLGARYSQQADTPPQVYRRINQVLLAERFGWTLDYIDSLDNETLAELLGTISGLDRVRNHDNGSRKSKGRFYRR